MECSCRPGFLPASPTLRSPDSGQAVAMHWIVPALETRVAGKEVRHDALTQQRDTAIRWLGVIVVNAVEREARFRHGVIEPRTNRIHGLLTCTIRNCHRTHRTSRRIDLDQLIGRTNAHSPEYARVISQRASSPLRQPWRVTGSVSPNWSVGIGTWRWAPSTAQSWQRPNASESPRSPRTTAGTSPSFAPPTPMRSNSYREICNHADHRRTNGRCSSQTSKTVTSAATRVVRDRNPSRTLRTGRRPVRCSLPSAYVLRGSRGLRVDLAGSCSR